PGEAVIRVDEPAGAVFALEGAPIGIAPLTVRVALPEDGRRLHKLTATRAGVVSTRGVVLKPGQTRNVKTRLTSLARPLFPLPASDTERRVAGRTIAPGEELLLPAGLYRMEEKSGAVKYVRAGGRLKIED
ncbi:hypothetical protein K8I61_06420, partial [bacterium]|nr:hypothetical protein [bacterium]